MNINEDLRKWVAEKWVDIGAPKKGGGFKPCGRQEGEKRKGYPKCVPLAKANSMSASQRRSAVKRKRAAGNTGPKPANVATFKNKKIQEACWKGYKAKGMKKKNGRMVPNCVPVNEGIGDFFAGAKKKAIQHRGKLIAAGLLGTGILGGLYNQNSQPGQIGHFRSPEKHSRMSREGEDAYGRAYPPGFEKDRDGDGKYTFADYKRSKGQAEIKARLGVPGYENFKKNYPLDQSLNNSVEYKGNSLKESSPAWQRSEGKDPKGGLNRKGIASYRAANPGSKLSMAVTTKPSKLKKGSKAANRRKSFCARMGGMKKRLTSAKTASDPNSRINKALRKWNC